MRAISFAKTEQQFVAGLKTVTRRWGWENLKPGTELRVVHKSQGLKKGESPRTIGFIRVVDVRREGLGMITHDEVAKEGFPEWTPTEFVAFFLGRDKNGYGPSSTVTRIEFVKIDNPARMP